MLRGLTCFTLATSIALASSAARAAEPSPTHTVEPAPIDQQQADAAERARIQAKGRRLIIPTVIAGAVGAGCSAAVIALSDSDPDVVLGLAGVAVVAFAVAIPLAVAADRRIEHPEKIMERNRRRGRTAMVTPVLGRRTAGAALSLRF